MTALDGTACCGYADPSVVQFNEFNGVVQCHNCGAIYEASEVAFDPSRYLDLDDPATIGRLATELDNHLPRMAFHQYGKFYNDDPGFDIEAYYQRVAVEMVAALRERTTE